MDKKSGNGKSDGKIEGRQGRKGRLAATYEWEMDSASEGSRVGDDFEEVDWRVEGKGWVEVEREWVSEVRTEVVEGKEREKERAGSEDEWEKVEAFKATKVEEKNKKKTGEKKKSTKVVAKEEIVPVKTAQAQKRLELVKKLHLKATENLQAEKEDEPDPTHYFQSQSHQRKRQPTKLTSFPQLPSKGQPDRKGEMTSENVDSDLRKGKQQRSQRPRPRISPRYECPTIGQQLKGT